MVSLCGESFAKCKSTLRALHTCSSPIVWVLSSVKKKRQWALEKEFLLEAFPVQLSQQMLFEVYRGAFITSVFIRKWHPQICFHDNYSPLLPPLCLFQPVQPCLE